MIRQMAIPITLIGFNDLGRSVTPTFLFRNRFYLQLSPLCLKMNKKSMWEVEKNSRSINVDCFLSVSTVCALCYLCTCVVLLVCVDCLYP